MPPRTEARSAGISWSAVVLEMGKSACDAGALSRGEAHPSVLESRASVVRSCPPCKIHFILPTCIGLTCSPASSRSGPIGLKGVCHEAEPKASRARAARAKIKCPWKGKRSCVLCAGFKDEIAQSVFRLASTSFTEVVLQLPTEVAAAMTLMDQQAREKWAAIIKGKLASLEHVAHLLAGAFAHHAMPDQFSLQRSKDIARQCFTNTRLSKLRTEARPC